jgi:DNA-binding transcriptional LysR family regulator
VDVSTRKLRYFVAVAEELHFSRAAARLYVAQQAMSKQIRELEESVGTTLLRRTTRSVSLTPAGELFLTAAREALAVLDAGVLASQQEGRRLGGTLRLGFMIGAALELTTPITSAFADRYPGVRVELREYGFSDPSSGLADGSADLALLRLPVQLKDLHFEKLFEEPLMLMLPAGHRLASRSSVSVSEILDEPLAIGRSADTMWRDFWTLADHRSHAATVVRETSSQTEELEVVASGVACAITVAGAARYTAHPRVRYVPISDAGGAVLGIGWREPNELVDRFIDVAREVRDSSPELLALIECR